MLPTNREVMKFFYYTRELLRAENCGREPTIHMIASSVAKKLCEIWRRASIPTVTESAVKAAIIRYHQKCGDIKRSACKPHKGVSLTKKIDDFKTNSRKLMDICTCKCQQIKKCTCKKGSKVPEKEVSFLIDQRTKRLLAIGGVDIKETGVLLKRARRLSSQRSHEARNSEIDKEPDSEIQVSDEEPLSPTSHQGFSTDGDNSISSELDMLCQEKIDVNSNVRKSLPGQMRLQLPTVTEILARTGVPTRAAAMIVTATLVDAKLINATDKSKVVDRSYLKRQKKKMLKKIADVEKKSRSAIEGLYFDGRKDETMQLQTDGKRTYQSKTMEEHIVLVQEPGSRYLGFVTPSSGTAKDITIAIIDFLLKNGINASNVKIIGCDGTNVNTGNKGGIVRLLELRLKRPLQRSICQLHCNELPLRHLIENLDGQTKGPYSFAGPIGLELKNCHTLPVIEFEPVFTMLDLDFVNPKTLSSDQQYLLLISVAVSEGFCEESLAKRTPGKMAHTRWVTTACRLLRLYISTETPSENLKTLVEFIQKVYAPLWFSIKRNHSIQDGAPNLWKLISWSRYLPQALKDIVDPVIQRNGYFGHPENILLAMITDEREEVRIDAWEKIAEARKTKPKETRIFTIPKLNFEAEDYTSLVQWNKVAVTEPPVLSDLDLEDFQRFAREGAIFKVDFPCHTQAVERCVKEVTYASTLASTEDERHLQILQRMKSRKRMPSFESKSEFRF